MLGSTLTEDKCRVCGGDGTDCNTVNGVLDQKVCKTCFVGKYKFIQHLQGNRFAGFNKYIRH